MKEVFIYRHLVQDEVKIWRMPKTDNWYPIVSLAINDPFETSELSIELELLFNEFAINTDLYRRLIVEVSSKTNSDFLFQAINQIEFIYLKSIHVVCEKYTPLFNNSRVVRCDSVEDGIQQILKTDARERNDGGKKLELSKLMNLIQRQEYNWPEVTSEVRMYLQDFNSHTIGYIKVTGNYPDGSAGTTEGKLITTRLEQFSERYSLNMLIVDFSEFNYSFGDALSIYPSRFDFELEKNGIEKSFCIILKDAQKENFAYLLKKGENRIYSTKQEAFQDLTSHLKDNRES